MNAKSILRDLIGFNTINDAENKKIINYIEKYLHHLGFNTEYKTKCLVMSNNRNPKIGFLGHTDTVSCSDDWATNPFELVEKNDNLYGLGTSDMKGSIAAILSAVAKLSPSELGNGIKLCFTYDEEIGFSGINELVERKTILPELMIIGEPTANEIINASKGLLELKVSFKGVSSHSSKPEEGVNAIEKCIDFISELKNYYLKLKEQVVNSKSLTMNVGIINGGRSVNIVPDYCEVMIDFRTVLEEQNQKIIKKARDLIKDSGEIEIINNVKPFLSSPNEVNMSDYITEASFIKSKKRIILGAGPINAHKKDEFISINSLSQLEEQYLELLRKAKM